MGSRTTLCCGWVALLQAFAGSLQGGEPAWGVQVGAVVPVSRDLRLTTAGPAPTIGMHAEWQVDRRLAVRVRMDAARFGMGHQEEAAQGWAQSLDTGVASLAAGIEVLAALPQAPSGLRVGLGIHETWWRVRSTNLITGAGGSARATGTITWGRFGLGPAATLRLTERWEAEARILFSHYGQENQPARTVSLGLVGRF